MKTSNLYTCTSPIYLRYLAIDNVLHFCIGDIANVIGISYEKVQELKHTEVYKEVLMNNIGHAREEWFMPYDEIKELIYDSEHFGKHLLKTLIEFNIAPNFADKYSLRPIIAQTIEVAKSNRKTMSSLEIAELTGKAHYNVIRDIEKLISELGDELKIEGISYIDKQNRSKPAYNLDRESALLLTSGYSAQLRLKIIRRLDELESGAQKPQLLPYENKPEELRLAATLAEETEQLKLENQKLNKTKHQISSTREASVMGKLGQATQEIKRLKSELEKYNEIAYAIHRPRRGRVI